MAPGEPDQRGYPCCEIGKIGNKKLEAQAKTRLTDQNMVVCVFFFLFRIVNSVLQHTSERFIKVPSSSMNRSKVLY